MAGKLTQERDEVVRPQPGDDLLPDGLWVGEIKRSRAITASLEDMLELVVPRSISQSYKFIPDQEEV